MLLTVGDAKQAAEACSSCQQPFGFRYVLEANGFTAALYLLPMEVPLKQYAAKNLVSDLDTLLLKERYFLEMGPHSDSS